MFSFSIIICLKSWILKDLDWHINILVIIKAWLYLLGNSIFKSLLLTTFLFEERKFEIPKIWFLKFLLNFLFELNKFFLYFWIHISLFKLILWFDDILSFFCSLLSHSAPPKLLATHHVLPVQGRATLNVWHAILNITYREVLVFFLLISFPISHPNWKLQMISTCFGLLTKIRQ